MPSSKLSQAVAAVSVFAVVIALAFGCFAAEAKTAAGTPKMPLTKPWMNKSLSPDERADLVIDQMTLDEKIQMVHGTGWGVLRAGSPIPARSNFGAGFMAGIDRLGIPDINLADSAVGVGTPGAGIAGAVGLEYGSGEVGLLLAGMHDAESAETGE